MPISITPATSQTRVSVREDLPPGQSQIIDKAFQVDDAFQSNAFQGGDLL